eukprot:s111_g56.t1
MIHVTVHRSCPAQTCLLCAMSEKVTRSLEIGKFGSAAASLSDHGSSFQRLLGYLPQVDSLQRLDDEEDLEESDLSWWISRLDATQKLDFLGAVISGESLVATEHPKRPACLPPTQGKCQLSSLAQKAADQTGHVSTAMG